MSDDILNEPSEHSDKLKSSSAGQPELIFSATDGSSKCTKCRCSFFRHGRQTDLGAILSIAVVANRLNSSRVAQLKTHSGRWKQ